jgi:restriction system protein
MTQAWIVRVGRDARYEEIAFEQQIVAIGWSATGDLSSHPTSQAIRDAVMAAYPDVADKSATSYAVQLLAFRSKMAEGDLVLLLRRTSPDVAVGWVTGPYRYRPDIGPSLRHTREVRWSRTDLPRSVVARELLALPALTMIFRVNQVDVVERLRALVGEETPQDGSPPPVEEAAVTLPGVTELSRPFVNLQRNLNYARNLATAGQHLTQLQVGSFEVADVFRAAWVQSVAALDHWVRQEIRARMRWLATHPGAEKPAGFKGFPLTLGLWEEVRSNQLGLPEAIDQQLRDTRGHLTYQHPDKIREGFALVGDVKGLWDKVAKVLSEQAGDGATVSATGVRQHLMEIVRRRNKIAHEYDEDPADPPRKRPIDAAAATETIDWIEQLAAAILVVLDQP